MLIFGVPVCCRGTSGNVLTRWVRLQMAPDKSEQDMINLPSMVKTAKWANVPQRMELYQL
jgi:hypothetical protein